METSAEPLTTIRCSLGLCQCQGTVQPGADLMSMIDELFAGSPDKTVPVVQVESRGSVVNFISGKFRPGVGAAGCWPSAEPAPTRRIANVAPNSLYRFVIVSSV